MKSRSVTALLLLVLTACTTPEKARPTPPAAGSPSALAAAHQAYLDSDWIALGERVRDVLLDPGSTELARENALELLDASYASQKGRLPSAVTLPEGFEFLQYETNRSQGSWGHHYNTVLRGRARSLTHVTNVVLKRLPDEIILDAQANKGKYEVSKDETGWDRLSLLSPKVSEVPPDGVFTVRITFDDAPAWEGWFIGRSMTSTSSPEIQSPAPSSPVADPNPVMTWAPFRSPQYASFEERTLSIWVGRENNGGLAWNVWTQDPNDATRVRIGDHPKARKGALEPGTYWLDLTKEERRNFGPFRLARGSSTVQPLTIVR
jgi:hypothetical protein